MHLKDKTVRAFLWVSSAKVVNQSFAWIVTIILARLLVPSDFGLIEMAWIFVNFLDLINELGIGAAVIQKSDLDERDLHSTFWFSICAGMFFYMITFIFAPAVAVFFNNERLVPILRVLGIIFIIGAVKTIPFNLLTKEMAFGHRSIAQFFAIISGGCCSIVLAFSGYGIWSLVYGTLLRHTVLTIIVLYLSTWKPRFYFRFENIKQILGFGISVAGARILSFFYARADALIIGKFLGDRLLGFYSMAFQLSTMPVHKITALVNEVALPVFSQLQNDDKSLRRYFTKITRFVSFLTFPAVTGAFLVSESLILVVLTEKWMPMLIPFKILCVIGLLKSVDTMIPVLLVAKGKPNIVFRYNALCIFILPSSFLFAAQYGINAVAFAWIIIYPFLLIYLYRKGLAELRMTLLEYIRILTPAIKASLFMTIFVVVFQIGDIYYYGENIYLTLTGSCIVGVVSYMVFVLYFQKDVLHEVHEIYRSLRFNKRSEIAVES